MPCQCGTTAIAERGACECATDPGANCECGNGGSTASEHAASLERIVMELDKRVRKLEASR